MIKYILTLSKHRNWELPAPMLLSVREENEGEIVCVTGTVNLDACSDDTLKGVAKICQSLTEDELYAHYGRKSFRKQEKFWAEADEKVKKYVKHIADVRTLDAVQRAVAAKIPVFVRTKEREFALTQSLKLFPRLATPHMKFSKKEDGTEYELTIAVDGVEHLVSSCGVSIIGYEPSLFCATLSVGENRERLLLRFPEDFSAKLLVPFLAKNKVFIPRKMESEYFRKFILKNAKKSDIEAVGFDVLEQKVERKALLCMEQTFNSKTAIILRYVYGNLTYDHNSKKMAAVTLEEQGEEFCFVKVSRDLEWEEDVRQRMSEIDASWSRGSDGMASAVTLFDSKANAVKWLIKNNEQINRLADVEVKQYSVNQYYIGNIRMQQRKSWVMDWLHLYIIILLDDGTRIPFLYFRQAIITGEEEVKLPNGKYFLLPKEWFASYAGMLMVAGSKGDDIVLHRSQLASLTSSVQDVDQEVADITEVKDDATAPQGLKASLRPYQQYGYHWLYRNFAAATGCCLADDMGLGKTIQTIALLLKYKEECKQSEETDNKEHSKKVNGKRVCKQQPVMLDMFADFFADANSTQQAENSSADAEDEVKGNGNALQHPYRTSIIICPPSLTYNWRNELRKFAPNLSVCEYTGSWAQRTKKLKGLMRWDVVIVGYRVAVNDIESLGEFDFGMAVFDESQTFKNHKTQTYKAMQRIKAIHHIALSGTPMENSLPELWSLMNVLNPRLLGDFKTFQQCFINPIKESLEDARTKILQRTVAPFFLGRRKEDVLTDLPPVQSEIVLCNMDEEQESLYQEELSAARNVVLSSVLDVESALRGKHSEGSNVAVLASIQRLRQTANDPRIIKHNVASAKTSAVLSHMESLIGTSHKVLLFSEYVSYLDIIASEIEKRGWKYSMLTGDTQDREKVINEFETSSDIQFFLISLKAGGVGLNLTSADYVFMLNPWWNSAAEEQAISRAHRIGQKRSVFVYRFITHDTIEEQILQLQDRKKSLVDAVLPFLVKRL